MSGFFGSFGRSGGSSKAPAKSVESRKAELPETSEIYTTPLEGIKPTKKWDYDEEQLKKVSPSYHNQMNRADDPDRSFERSMYLSEDDRDKLTASTPRLSPCLNRTIITSGNNVS